MSPYALLDVTPVVCDRHFPYWEFLTFNVMAHIGRLPEGTPVVAKEPVASRDRNGGASTLAFGRRGASCVSGAARTFVLLRSVVLCASTCRNGRDGYSKLDSFVLFPLFASGYAGRIEAIRIAASPFQET